MHRDDTVLFYVRKVFMPDIKSSKMFRNHVVEGFKWKQPIDFCSGSLDFSPILDSTSCTVQENLGALSFILLTDESRSPKSSTRSTSFGTQDIRPPSNAGAV